MVIKVMTKLSNKMLDELYLESTPSISWVDIKKLYSKTNRKYFENHKIEQETSFRVLEKYLDECDSTIVKRRLLKDFAKYGPSFLCETCLGFGLWGIGCATPIDLLDAFEFGVIKRCPECGSKGIKKNVWFTGDWKMIPVASLTNEHLKNIVRDLKKHNKINKMIDREVEFRKKKGILK